MARQSKYLFPYALSIHLSLCIYIPDFLPMLFRFVVIDLSAGPCTYGKIEAEEGTVSSRTLPRLRNVMFPRGTGAPSDHPTHDVFIGQLASLVSTTVEHVIAPDVRYSVYLLTCLFEMGLDYSLPEFLFLCTPRSRMYELRAIVLAPSMPLLLFP